MYIDNYTWVFLSHSNEDYDKVAIVRNILEKQNCRPLMFFLRCLTDKDEINNLIEREIDCRTRFILCDSDNARNSTWVKSELEYIKSKNRTYEVVDVRLSESEIKKQLLDFVEKTRIFISYNRDESKLASEFYSRIRKYDFSVYMDRYYVSPQNYVQDYSETLSNLDLSVADGCVVAFVSPRVLHSSSYLPGSCRYELVRAVKRAEISSKIPNTIIFASDDSILSELSQDELLSPLCKSHVFSLKDVDDDKKCNFVLENVLRILSPSTSIGAYADIFMKGLGRPKDENESAWISSVALKSDTVPVVFTNETGEFVCRRNTFNAEVTLHEFNPAPGNIVVTPGNDLLTVNNLFVPDGINHFCDFCLSNIVVKNMLRLPKTLMTIGGIDSAVSKGNVFFNSVLPEVVIPPFVTVLGLYAFSRCKIRRLVLPEGLTTTFAYQFDGSHVDTLKVSTVDWKRHSDDSLSYMKCLQGNFLNLELY